MNKLQLKVLAGANLLNKGRGFCIIQSRPDSNGDYYVSAISCTKSQAENAQKTRFGSIVLLGSGEKILWSGTPKQYVEQQPTFTEKSLGKTIKVNYWAFWALPSEVTAMKEIEV